MWLGAHTGNLAEYEETTVIFEVHCAFTLPRQDYTQATIIITHLVNTLNTT